MSLFFRFLTVGIFNTVLGYIVIFVCMYLINISPETSNIIGYSVGLMSSYLLNRNYTFKSSAKKIPELTRFLIVFLLSYGANYYALLVMVYKLDIHEGVSQVCSGAIYVATSFILNKVFVFKENAKI